MESLDKVESKHGREGRSLRLGQFFCNRYIKAPWPELYYEESTEKAREMIRAWLIDHHYLDKLPPTLS